MFLSLVEYGRGATCGYEQAVVPTRGIAATAKEAPDQGASIRRTININSLPLESLALSWNTSIGRSGKHLYARSGG